MCDGLQARLEAEAADRLEDFIESIPRGKGFANARTVRNLFNGVMQQQALRLGGKDSFSTRALTTIRAADIPDPIPAEETPEGDAPGYM